MTLSSLTRAWTLAACTLLAATAFAQDDPAARQAAADRYLQAVPVAKMLEDTYGEIAKQVPPDQRDRFLSQMRAAVRVEHLTRISRDAMVKTFSADELNALADFYTSRHGASAMKKFGVYMAAVMPPLMQEVDRAVRQVQQAPAPAQK